LITLALATFGIAMTSLPAAVVGGMLAAAAAFAFLVDFVKVPVLRRLGLD